MKVKFRECGNKNKSKHGGRGHIAKQHRPRPERDIDKDNIRSKNNEYNLDNWKKAEYLETKDTYVSALWKMAIDSANWRESDIAESMERIKLLKGEIKIQQLCKKKLET